MEGIPALVFWESVLDTLCPQLLARGDSSRKAGGDSSARETDEIQKVLSMVDFVPPSLPPLTGRAQLIMLEDNDAVIKMIIKG